MEVSFSILLLLALVCLFLFGSRGEEKTSMPRSVKPPPAPVASRENGEREEERKKERAVSWSLEERKEKKKEPKNPSMLPTDWKRAKSLKHALILSEILKRKDFFF